MLVVLEIFKYLKRNKLEELKSIKNSLIQIIIRKLFFRRFTIEKFTSLENLEKQSYYLYDDTINIDYLKSKKGIELLIKLSKVNLNDIKRINGIAKCDNDVEFYLFVNLNNYKYFI